MITLEGAQLGLCSPPAPDGVPRTLKKKAASHAPPGRVCGIVGGVRVEGEVKREREDKKTRRSIITSFKKRITLRSAVTERRETTIGTASIRSGTSACASLDRCPRRARLSRAAG